MVYDMIYLFSIHDDRPTRASYKIPHPISILFLAVLLMPAQAQAQNSFTSESVITYDLKTHKTDKPIPFDRPFTLVVHKIPITSIGTVEAFEAEIVDGKRDLKDDIVVKDKTASVRDILLKCKAKGDTLAIYFPPLKPNKDFDVSVSGVLDAEARGHLMEVMDLLARNKGCDAQKIYEKSFLPTLRDPELLRRVGYMPFTDFKTKFSAGAPSLKSLYDDVLLVSNYQHLATALSQEQIQAIDMQAVKDLSNFRDAALLADIVRRGLWKELEWGQINGAKVFDPKFTTADLWAVETRIKNLKANFLLLDSLLSRVNRIITKGTPAPVIAGHAVTFLDIQTLVGKVMQNITNNSAFLSGKLKAINTILDEEKEFRQSFFLVGTTVASDLKAKGGNILFLDLGLSNIVVPGLTGGADYIPKPYYGVSIYFRPIDKNTRTRTFRRKFTDRSVEGPDYNIASKWDLRQHLALNVGLTMGSMPVDYDNFYNNTSLLVGPSYRFARGFKLSMGAAMLKQTSRNPVVSDKVVVAGYYLGLSVDIDVVQGLKDITGMIWK